MKLTSQQRKVFNTIRKNLDEFNFYFFAKKDFEKAELYRNYIFKKCDFLLQLFKDQVEEKTRLYSVNDYCNQIKEPEYQITAFVNDTKDYINNTLANKDTIFNNNHLRNYLRGLEK